MRTTTEYVLVGFAVGAAPSPGLVLSDPPSSCLGYGAVSRLSTARGCSYVVRLMIICWIHLPKTPRFFFSRQYVWKYYASWIFILIHKLSLYYRIQCFVYVLLRFYSSTLICVTLYVPDTGVVFTAVISPTCDYCCCFAATAADAGDGALYWCCYIYCCCCSRCSWCAAPYCWSATKMILLCLWNFMSDEIVIPKRLSSATYW